MNGGEWSGGEGGRERLVLELEFLCGSESEFWVGSGFRVTLGLVAPHRVRLSGAWTHGGY